MWTPAQMSTMEMICGKRLDLIACQASQCPSDLFCFPMMSLAGESESHNSVNNKEKQVLVHFQVLLWEAISTLEMKSLIPTALVVGITKLP
jgi:hypothetical protein